MSNAKILQDCVGVAVFCAVIYALFVVSCAIDPACSSTYMVELT
jgi:hypothetical protein